MNEKILSLALGYYKSMSEKNIPELKQYLHPNVQVISPLATVTGIQSVLEASKGFVQIFKSLTIKSQFISNNQIMLVMDLDCPEPIGFFRSAVMMTFLDNLIIRNELFYDTRPLEKYKEKIFSREI
ncbi:hypothetical protein GCL60_02485 [Silvanigrella paludirubra]|uniref:SnoaL-like domain-containing protein n=1 Tax=Silvanigrella paludirubra TaxID=2499159 RepID=A0A6N6VVZ9_9BACT|nr:nuclear transport factor 2 family protein [Silvanigrella paludirubra]KAB8040815.1 hypothetical protein GCL60_02485 [Silvanigrella paludirubra]